MFGFILEGYQFIVQICFYYFFTFAIDL